MAAKIVIQQISKGLISVDFNKIWSILVRFW